MKPLKSISSGQRNQFTNLGARWVMSVFLSLAILFGQSVSAVAGLATSADGGWVEICTEGGSYFAQIDGTSKKEMPDCAHCNLCLLPLADPQNLQISQQSMSIQFGFETFSYPVDLAAKSDRPEQFWVACRGPPMMNKNTKLPKFSSLVSKEPPVIHSNTGSM